MGSILSRLSITGLPFLAALAAAAAVAVALRIALRHRRFRALATVAAIVVGVVAGAAGVNAYFDYVPTVGALVGRRAADQSTWAAARTAAARRAAVGFAAGTRPDRHGRVVLLHIPPTVSGFHARSTEIYLPPAWFQHPQPRLPVVELLHGTPGAPYDWTRSAVGDVVGDRWAAAHAGVAPILVLPDENGSFFADTECVDGRAGRAETYLTVDVRRWVVDHLGAAPDRSHWAIGGASEGGYCALTLAVNHPDLFGTFFDVGGLDHPTHHGGAARLFSGPGSTVDRALRHHDDRWLLRHRRFGGRRALAGWFEAGGADGGTTRAVTNAAALARAAGISTHLVVDPGAHHTWRMFRAALHHAYPWLATRLGAGVDPRA
jgi:S-formylglutathione hydrolase FrmB